MIDIVAIFKDGNKKRFTFDDMAARDGWLSKWGFLLTDWFPS